MRLFFIFFIFLLHLFSSNGKITALGGSGSIDVHRVDSVHYFEANLARNRQEAELYLSISIKSSHQNILSQTDKINIYNTQKKDIAVNLAGEKVSNLGIISIQNALDAIEDINQNQNQNMIEYIFPDITLSYRFRNIGFGFHQKSYRYAYIHSIAYLEYDKEKSYTNNSIKYIGLKQIYDGYMKNSLQLRERYITLNEFFMSYSNTIPLLGNKLLYGLSIKIINAEYLSESNNSLNKFNNKTIYENIRKGKVGASASSKVAYNFSFIFLPSFTRKVNFGIAFSNLNTSTFGDFYYDSQIIFSGNYLLNNYLTLHYEKDLKEYKNIYQTKINKKQSFGLEFKVNDFSLLAGYEQNKNIFKDEIMSIGFSYGNMDVGYRTISNFATYSNGSLKDFGELVISFRKDT
jgi:hypothetical protein